MQAAQRQPNRSPVVPAAMVLIASVFLGVAYNSASPLGIRSAPSAKGALDSPLSVTRRTGAFNQMMPATAPSPGASSSMGSVYQNETVSVSLAAADAPANRPIPLLSWPEVKALLQAGKIVLVDARGSSFYQADHI